MRLMWVFPALLWLGASILLVSKFELWPSNEESKFVEDSGGYEEEIEREFRECSAVLV